MIEILYFARVRECLGTGRESLPLPPGVVTAGDLVAHLRARGAPWAEALSEGRTLIAVNQNLARPDTPLHDGDEIGLFPPVTGG